MNTRIPAGAMSAIDRYLEAVDRVVPGLVVGLHVVGSLALDDYLPDRSDIDVVAVVAEPPSASARALLAEVHRVVATRVDGPYLPAAALRGDPARVGEVPYHVAGRFEFGCCHEVSPITWAILADRAITVRGDPPPTRADEAAVRAFSAANLRGYWAGWAQTIGSLVEDTDDDDVVEATLLEWGVLGAARVHCAATTGRVVSKREAGEYALESSGGEWRAVAQLALDSRAGEIDEVRVAELRRACAFVTELGRRL